MTFDQIIRERYSCKCFDPNRQISNEQLNAILEAGRVAPTAKNLMMLDLGFAGEGAAPLTNHFSRKPLEETVTYL